MGPRGQGPMTGGGMGWCGGARAHGGVEARGLGIGRGRGRGMPRRHGRGQGWCYRNGLQAIGLRGWQQDTVGGPRSDTGYPPVLSKAQEVALLKQQAENMEQSLAALKSRIQDLDESPSDGEPPTEP